VNLTISVGAGVAFGDQLVETDHVVLVAPVQSGSPGGATGVGLGFGVGFAWAESVELEAVGDDTV
jgi:hypothetical protein